MFNNREVALGIIVGLILLFVAKKKEFRPLVLSVIRSALQFKLIIPLILSAVWIVFCIWCLTVIGVWNPKLLNETLKWFVLSGGAIVYRGISPRDPNSTFLTLAKDQFKALVVFELVINAYSFSLVAELLIAILLIFFSLMHAVASRDIKHRSVRQVFGCAIALLGLVIVGSAIYGIMHAPTEVLSRKGLDSLWLPAVLAICMIPFGYGMAVCAAYEILLIRFRRWENQPHAVHQYAILQLMEMCHLNASLVKQVQPLIAQGHLRGAMTKEEVDTEIRRLKSALSLNY